jgi:hypothetical protein
LKASAKGTFSKGDYPFTLHNGNLTTLEKRLNSDVQSYGAEANFYADWDNKGQLKAKLNFYSSERGLPGSVVLYTQNAYERLWDKSFVSSIIYDCNLGEKWKIHADAGFTNSFNRHLDTDPVYPDPQDSRYTQNEYSLAARVLYKPVAGWKIALAEDLFCNTLISNIPECPFPVRLSSISALSAKYEAERFKISANFVGTYITEESATGETPSDRFRLSPTISASWMMLARSAQGSRTEPLTPSA